MSVRVMHVGDVRMLVRQTVMAMPVRVRLARRIVGPVGVPMVHIVHMRMAMLLGLMDVLVVMILGQVQPDADAHEQASDRELQRHGLAQSNHRYEGADKRGRREVGTGPG